MFTEFHPRPDMRAIELEHHQVAPMPLHVASLITSELGEPSYRGKHWSAWYADAMISEGSMPLASVPMVLRIDIEGHASLTVPWSQRDVISRGIASLVPHLIAEPRFEGRQERAHRR